LAQRSPEHASDSKLLGYTLVKIKVADGDEAAPWGNLSQLLDEVFPIPILRMAIETHRQQNDVWLELLSQGDNRLAILGDFALVPPVERQISLHLRL